MKWFVRVIKEKHLFVGIETQLYCKNKSLFNVILNTYHECNNFQYSEANSSFLHIVQNGINNNTHYVCNISNNYWIHDLLNHLEDWYSKVLNCTVFHGSCVIINGKSVLLLGNRKRGKTTLTGYLSIIKKMPYLDDDCIYYYRGEVLGFNMPLSIRNNVDNLPNDLLITTTMDIDNVERDLFVSPVTVPMTNRIDIVVFPRYNYNSIGEIDIINDSNLLVNMLIGNIRHHNSVESVCHDICEIVKSATTISLNYPDSITAYKMLINAVRSI